MRINQKSIVLLSFLIGLTGCDSGLSASPSSASSTPTIVNSVAIDASQEKQVLSPSVLTSVSVNPQLTAAASCLTADGLSFSGVSTASAPLWYISGSFKITNTCSTAQQIQNTLVLLNGGATTNVWNGGSFTVNSFTPWLGNSPAISTLLSGSQLQLTINNSYQLAAKGIISVSFGYNQNGTQLTTSGASVAIAGAQPAPPPTSGSLQIGIDSSSLSSSCNATNLCNIAVNLLKNSNVVYKTVATITSQTGSNTYRIESLPAGTYTLAAANLPSNATFNSTPVSIVIANGSLTSVNSGFSVTNPASNCLTAKMGSVSYGQYWISGSLDLQNTCATPQPLAGTQIGIASSSPADILNSSALQINSTTPYIANFASISGNASSIVLTANSTSGNLAALGSLNVAFGYDPKGIALNGTLAASVFGQTPVQPATLAATVDSSGLSCSVLTPCNIAVILSDQSGIYTKTLTSTITSSAKTVYRISGLNPGSYTLSTTTLPANVLANYVPAATVALKGGESAFIALELKVKPVTSGTLSFTLINPNSNLFNPQSLPVVLKPSSGSSVAVQSVLGQATSVSLNPGTYTLSSLGLASASKGSYYLYPSPTATVALGTNSAVGNIAALANSATMASDAIIINGLHKGDSVTLNFSDNKYVYNPELITATAESVAIATPYKFLLGDTLTANVVVNSSNNSYLAVAPVSFTVASSAPVNYTINLTTVVKPLLKTVYSSYKDAGTSMNWSAIQGSWAVYEMGTTAGTMNLGSATSLVSAMKKNGLDTVTWAFATGDCSNEAWVGAPVNEFITANVNAAVKNNINYIVSTGGAAGAFTCANTANMIAFAKRYMSANLLGFDFDIEGSQLSSSQLSNLVNSIAGLQLAYPNLRISFTLPTLASSDGTNVALVSGGKAVMSAIQAAGLTNYYVNLMAMDYTGVGQASPSTCYLHTAAKTCDMGNSAIQAAKNFMLQYPSVPASHVELTPLIGVNDIADEIFTLDDAATVASYVKTAGLGGLHYWSFDRDVMCNTNVTTTCNGLPASLQTTALMFATALK